MHAACTLQVLGMLHSFLHYNMVSSQVVSLVALALGGTGLDL